MSVTQDYGKVRILLFKSEDWISEILDSKRILHPLELERYLEMSPNRSIEFVQGRYVMKKLLQTKLGGEMVDICVTADEDGKPFIANHPELFVSISHSHGYVAAAVSEYAAVGIDIEQISTRHSALLRNIASQEETAIFSDVFSMNALPTSIWTIKEAVSKADKNIHPFNEYYLSRSGEGLIEAQRLKTFWSVNTLQEKSYICALAIAK